MRGVSCAVYRVRCIVCGVSCAEYHVRNTVRRLLGGTLTREVYLTKNA